MGKKIAAVPEAFYLALEQIAIAAAESKRSGQKKGGIVAVGTSYAQAALQDECKAVENTGEGDRNNRLNVAAFNLGQLVGAQQLARADVERALAAAGSKAGLSDTEVAGTIQSGLDAGIAVPREVPAPKARNREDAESRPATIPIKGPAKSGEAAPERRTIVVEPTEMNSVIDEAEAAIAADDNIFSRSYSLVRVLAVGNDESKHQPDRPADTPVIAPVEDATLTESLCRHAVFLKPTIDRKGNEFLKPITPPPLAVSGLQARGTWPSIRRLEGIIEAPTIRPDGSILDNCGWDERTGLLLIPSGKFKPIPSTPSREDARRAADQVLDLVVDIPFKNERHRAGWLAATLTVVGRPAILGPVPMFGFDANLRSSGKTKACDASYNVAAGRNMPRKAYPEDDAEMRKVLTSIALAGDRVTLFDNIATGGVVGGPSLDIVLTADTWQDRILATNRQPVMDWRAVLFCTGNNLSVRSDTFSRMVVMRIVSPLDRPEERSAFKISDCQCGCDGDLPAHARNARDVLLPACLTILRAHALAGWPIPEGLPMNRYQSWRRVIQAAVFWATGVDPWDIADDERVADSEAVEAEAIAAGWKKLCKEECKPFLTIASALKALDLSPCPAPELREIMLGWSRDKELPSARSVGHKFRSYKDRPTPAGTLTPTPPQSGIIGYFVREPGGFSGESGFPSPPSRASHPDVCKGEKGNREGQGTHQTNQTHYDDWEEEF
jgi:hypothetical protein